MTRRAGSRVRIDRITSGTSARSSCINEMNLEAILFPEKRAPRGELSALGDYK